jgi:hypothetical protein
MWVWRIAAMILAGECTKYLEETGCTTNFSVTNSKRTGLGSKLGLRGKRPATDALRFRPVITVCIKVERKKK